MKDTLIYCGGRWMPHCNLSKDLGLWRASGVLEVVEAQRNIMFHWHDHYRRLLSSCAGYNPDLLGALPFEDDLKLKIGWLLDRVDKLHSVVWILVSEGDSDNLKDSKGEPKII